MTECVSSVFYHKSGILEYEEKAETNVIRETAYYKNNFDES